MVIEENENANYLAHYKTKGAKNGIRRFQSYLVQPNPSGATGQEVGEAAEQRQRITGHDERKDDQHQNEYRREEGGDRNASMQRLQERITPRKKTAAEILQDRKKKKWAKSYRSLYKHADSFSNKELNDAITRLDLKDRIRNKHLSSLARNTQDGSNALRNIAQGSASMMSIYNALALGVNAYNSYTDNKKRSLPTINTGLIGLGGGGGGKDKKKDDKKFGHSNMPASDYIAHFGVPGMKWFKRHFQSYKTAPTRSGKVGEEIGLAAKQAERLDEEEKPLAEHGPFLIMPKELRDSDFRDTTPDWYKNYGETKDTRQYSKELDDPMNNNSSGIKKTNATLSINSDATKDVVDIAVQFAKDFKKHDANIKDAITEYCFGSSGRVPWAYEKGYEDSSKISARVKNMSLDEKKKFFSDHLGCRESGGDKTFTTGEKYIAINSDGTASAYYDDGGAFWGHCFEVFIDPKTGKIEEIMLAG